MNKILLKSIFIFLFAGSVFSYAQAEQKIKTQQQNRVEVYYFHGNFRCPTCFKIEQYSREAVESNFKDELGSGKITFRAVNIEEKGNEHFVNDYQLYTRSLIISLVKDGKETKYSNLTKVWEHIRNKEIFFEYVKKEITNYLKEL